MDNIVINDDDSYKITKIKLIGSGTQAEVYTCKLREIKGKSLNI